MAAAPSTGDGLSDSAPWKAPMGVRLAPTMTIVSWFKSKSSKGKAEGGVPSPVVRSTLSRDDPPSFYGARQT